MPVSPRSSEEAGKHELIRGHDLHTHLPPNEPNGVLLAATMKDWGRDVMAGRIDRWCVDSESCRCGHVSLEGSPAKVADSRARASRLLCIPAPRPSAVLFFRQRFMNRFDWNPRTADNAE